MERRRSEEPTDETGPGPRTGLLDLVAFPLLALLVGRLAWSRLSLRAEVLDAPLAALARVPPGWFWMAVAGIGALLAAAGLWGLVRRRAAPVRGFYVFAALVLFVQVFILPAVRFPLGLPGDLVAAGTVQRLGEELAVAADPAGRLPDDPEGLRQALSRMGVPPYLVHGAPMTGWGVAVRTGCEGPPSDVAGLRAGTVIWCLRSDRRAGWLTLVGTGGREVGPAALARGPSGPVVVAVEPPPEAPAEGPPGTSPEPRSP